LDGKGRKDNGKILTVPFTFILSCRGREEKQGKILKDPLTLPSPAKWRGKNGDEKNLTAPLTFILSRKGRENLKEFI
jgi:hypothetical protein